MSIGRIFKFSKPKNPGYGISKAFYYSVLAGQAQLPSPDEVANPQGARGAVEGLLAPLMEGSTKEDLQKPLARGVYAIATKDRKSVLRLTVLSKEEAGFDTEVIARSAFALQTAPESLARIRAAWTILQLNFESHDAMVAPAMAFINDLARKLAETTEGIVADPMGQRYLLPNEIPRVDPQKPVSAFDHLAVHVAELGQERIAYTQGMRKFSQPDFEIRGFSAERAKEVGALLLSVAQARLVGEKIAVGEKLGSRQAAFSAEPGGGESSLLRGAEAIELVPAGGKSVEECLAEWVREAERFA